MSLAKVLYYGQMMQTSSKSTAQAELELQVDEVLYCLSDELIVPFLAIFFVHYFKNVSMQTRLLFRPLATLLRSRTALCTSKSSLRAFSSTTIRAVSVDKKTVLITGGSRGIGSAIATLFAHNGASCILVGRNRPTLVDVASGLRQEPGDERHWSHVHGVRVGDVSSREFWEELRKDEKVKEVDILVNVAGITHSSLLVNSSADMLEDVVRTNLMGTIWGCKYLGKNMMRRKTGCIVNVGSLLGVKGGSGSTVYAASKAGIVGMFISHGEDFKL